MNMKRMILAVLLAAAGCLARSLAVHGQTGAEAGAARNDCTLTYANFGKAFTEKYCLRCHTSSKHNWFTRRGAPKRVDFDTYEGIQKRSERVRALAAAAAKMPKGRPKPTEEERRQLGAWIACGLPQ